MSKKSKSRTYYCTRWTDYSDRPASYKEARSKDGRNLYRPEVGGNVLYYSIYEVTVTTEYLCGNKYQYSHTEELLCNGAALHASPLNGVTTKELLGFYPGNFKKEDGRYPGVYARMMRDPRTTWTRQHGFNLKWYAQGYVKDDAANFKEYEITVENAPQDDSNFIEWYTDTVIEIADSLYGYVGGGATDLVFVGHDWMVCKFLDQIREAVIEKYGPNSGIEIYHKELEYGQA